MFNVLSSLFIRLKHSKLFLWFMLVGGIILPVVNCFLEVALTRFLLDVSLEEHIYQLNLMGQSGKTISLGELSITSTGGIFAIICAGVLCAGEFSQGTVKNCVFAYGRAKTFLAHAVFAPCVIAILVLTSFVGNIICFGITFGWTVSSNLFAEFGEILCWILLCVVNSIAIGSFLNFLIVTIKSTAGSILTFFGVLIGCEIIFSIVFSIIIDPTISTAIIEWLPVYQMQELISRATLVNNGDLYLKTLLIGATISTLFGFANYKLWQKVDFK